MERLISSKLREDFGESYFEYEPQEVVYYQQVRDIMNVVKMGDFEYIRASVAKYCMYLPDAQVRGLAQELVNLLFHAVTHFDYDADERVQAFARRLCVAAAQLSLDAVDRRRAQFVAQNAGAAPRRAERSVALWRLAMQRLERPPQ